MAEDLKAQVVIEAQDRASQVIQSVTGELGALGEAMDTIIGFGGGVGIALGAVAAGLGAITFAGVKLSDQVEQLQLLSTRTGVAAENLQVLQEEVKLMGGDVGTLTTALTFLNRSIAQGDPLLKKLGITSKDVMTVFTQLSDIFAHSTDSARKAEIGFQLMGRGSAELLGVLPQLSAEFGNTRRAMDEAGGLMKGDVLESAKKLDEQADHLKLTWDGLMTRMKVATLPTAQAVVGALNDMWDAIAGTGRDPASVARKQIEAAERELAAAQANLSFQKKREAPDDPLVTMAEARVAKLQMAVDKLKGLRAETEDEEQALMDAETRRQQRAAGPEKPLPDLTPPTQREKDLKAFAEKMGMTTEKAKALFDAMERIDKLDFRQTVADKLEKEGQLESLQIALGLTRGQAEALYKTVEEGAKKATAQQAKYNDAVKDVAAAFNVDSEQLKGLFDSAKTAEAAGDWQKFSDAIDASAKLLGLNDDVAKRLFSTVKKGNEQGLEQFKSDLLDIQSLFGGSVAEAAALYEQLKTLDDEDRLHALKERLGTLTFGDSLKDFDKTMDHVLRIGTITKDTLDNVFGALQSGFDSVFQSIIAGTATAGSILKTMWHAIVDAIVQELARIAAAELISGAIKVLGAVLPFLSVAPSPAELPMEAAKAPAPAPPQAAVQATQPAPAPAQPLALAAPAPVPLSPPQAALRAVEPPAAPQQPAPRAAQRPAPVSPPQAALRAVRPPVMPAPSLRVDLRSFRIPQTQLAALVPHEQRGVIAPAAAAPEPVPTNVQNIVVYGYDNHSIVQDLTSPAGKMRAARGKLAFMGAY